MSRQRRSPTYRSRDGLTSGRAATCASCGEHKKLYRAYSTETGDKNGTWLLCYGCLTQGQYSEGTWFSWVDQ